jgi:hypothetical protein
MKANIMKGGETILFNGIEGKLVDKKVLRNLKKYSGLDTTGYDYVYKIEDEFYRGILLIMKRGIYYRHFGYDETYTNIISDVTQTFELF